MKKRRNSLPKMDEIFLCAASFEERCLTGSKILLQREYRAKNAVIFVYDSHDLAELRDIRFKELDNLINSFCERSHPITSDLYMPFMGIRELSQLSVASSLFTADAPCTIDASTFTKQHLLLLMKFLDESKCLPHTVIYTRTRRPIYSRLTEGVSKVLAIPGFGGDSSPRLPTILFLMLGFEPDRAMAVWHELEPAITIAILGEFFDTPTWRRRLVEIHRELLNRDTVKEVTIRADLPEATCTFLDKEFKKLKGKYNICVVPFGTKAQTLGTYDALRSHSGAQVIYCSPYRYLPNYPKRGVGNTIFFQRDQNEGSNEKHYILSASV